MTDRKEKEELKHVIKTEIYEFTKRMLEAVFDPHSSTCPCRICSFMTELRYENEIPEADEYVKQYEVEDLIKKHLGHLIDDDTAHDLAIDIANIYEKQ